MRGFLPILSGVGGALVLAGAIHKHVHTAPDLAPRIRSWWVIVTILSAAFLAGPQAMIAAFAVISFLALREFLTISSVEAADRHAVLASFFVVLPVQYALIARGQYQAFALFVPLAAFGAIPVVTALKGDTRNFTPRASEHAWGLMVCVYGLSHIPGLLMFDRGLLIVFLILVAQASDVMQYVCGRFFGRRKLAPSISPSKTVEGLLGGVLGATALGAGLWWITPFSILQAAGLALVIALAGFSGGLVMSAIKRDRGVKDWSHLIPGHGGVLDRADSLWLSAPVFFHLARWIAS